MYCTIVINAKVQRCSANCYSVYRGVCIWRCLLTYYIMYNSFIRIARRLFSKHLQIHYIGDKDGDFRAETGYRRREFCALKGPFCPRGNESKHNSFVLHIRRNTTIPTTRVKGGGWWDRVRGNTKGLKGSTEHF